MNMTKYSNKEVKIRKQVIKQINNQWDTIKEVYKNHPKGVTTIGIS